jgi:hypothetical protein
MNAREGMRRVGLVLGIVGGTIGALIAYPTAEQLWSARADWFARNAPGLNGPVAYEPKDKALSETPEGDALDRVAAQMLREKGGIVVLVDLDGIKEVTVDKAGQVSSIELLTGESVPRAERPPLRSYAALLLYPVIGFLVPWGIVRILYWVSAGFLS